MLHSVREIAAKGARDAAFADGNRARRCGHPSGARACTCVEKQWEGRRGRRPGSRERGVATASVVRDKNRIQDSSSSPCTAFFSKRRKKGMRTAWTRNHASYTTDTSRIRVSAPSRADKPPFEINRRRRSCIRAVRVRTNAHRHGQRRRRLRPHAHRPQLPGVPPADQPQMLRVRRVLLLLRQVRVPGGASVRCARRVPHAHGACARAREHRRGCAALADASRSARRDAQERAVASPVGRPLPWRQALPAPAVCVHALHPQPQDGLRHVGRADGRRPSERWVPAHGLPRGHMRRCGEHGARQHVRPGALATGRRAGAAGRARVGGVPLRGRTPV